MIIDELIFRLNDSGLIVIVNANNYLLKSNVHRSNGYWTCSPHCMPQNRIDMFSLLNSPKRSNLRRSVYSSTSTVHTATILSTTTMLRTLIDVQLSDDRIPIFRCNVAKAFHQNIRF